MIGKAQRETRFRRARGADRLDGRRGRHALSVRRGARAAGRAGVGARGPQARRGCRRRDGRVCDRSRRIGRTVRAISRTLARRTGRRPRSEVIALNAKAGRAMRRSVARGATACRARRARRPAAAAPRPSCGGRASSTSWPSAASRVVEQIEQRARGREDHRPAGLDRRPRRAADPQGQARQAERVRLRRPDRRGDRATPAAARAASSCPPPTRRQPGENTLLADDRSRARPARDPAARGRARRRLRPTDVATSLADARRRARVQSPAATNPARAAPANAWPATAPASRAGSATSNAATACAAPASKATTAQRTWTGWAILAYNLDTLAIRTT